MQRATRWLAVAALALALTSISVSGADAQTRYWRSGFVFSVEPRMNFIPNTSIYYDRRASGYDMYRYGNRWYLVDQGSWYTANDWRGPFVVTSYSRVPDEFTTLPESYRRYWNSSDGVITADVPDGSMASPRTFSRKPKMDNIGRGVSYARNTNDFDLYRFRSTWYLVEDGIWYKSDSWRGPFFSMRANRLPHEVVTVSSAYRRHWYATNDRYRNRGYDRDNDYDRDNYRSSNTYNNNYNSDRFWSSGMTFDVQPELRVIPSTNVYYLRDNNSAYEMYRYGNTWYVMDRGRWYSANTWRGPFVSITVSSVPRDIMNLPYSYRYYWRSED
jgi:hypothetical protein